MLSLDLAIMPCLQQCGKQFTELRVDLPMRWTRNATASSVRMTRALKDRMVRHVGLTKRSEPISNCAQKCARCHRGEWPWTIDSENKVRLSIRPKMPS